MDYLNFQLILGLGPILLLVLVRPRILNFKTTFFYTILGAVTFGVPWDSLIFRRVYELNPDVLIGIHIFKLPIEEYLLFIFWPLLLAISFLFIVTKKDG